MNGRSSQEAWDRKAGPAAEVVERCLACGRLVMELTEWPKPWWGEAPEGPSDLSEEK